MSVNIETLEKIIDYQTIAFIASIDDGFPVMKAMLKPRKREGLKIFYFTTNTSSERVSQYQTNENASIYFCDQRFFRGVLLKGKMEVLTDAETKNEIWRDGDETYYAKGVEDPDYCVLKFVALSGRFYSNFKSHNFQV